MEIPPTKPEEEQRDAFGRAIKKTEDPKHKGRSPSSSSDSSDSDSEREPPPVAAAVARKRKPARSLERSPKRRNRGGSRSRSRSPRRRVPRRHPDRRPRRSRSRSPHNKRQRGGSTGGHDLRRRKKPKSFKEFMMKLPDDVSPEKAQEEYKKYKEMFDKSRESIFYKEHKGEEWFKEKYDPVYLEKAFRKRTKEAHEKSKLFVEDFVNGRPLDIIKKDCVEPLKAEEAEETKTENNLPEGVSMKKPGERRPENMEFRGPQSDNFRSDTNSDERVCHNNTVFIQGIPLAVGRSNIEQVFAKAEGFKHLVLTDPVRSERRIQNGYATFENQEQCKKVMLGEEQGGLNGKRIVNQYYLTLFPKHIPKNNGKHYIHDIFLHRDRISEDLQQVLGLIRKWDERLGIHEHSLFSTDSLESVGPTDLHKLNFALEYLHRVHYCSYYEARRFFTTQEMKCPTLANIKRNRGDFSEGLRTDVFPLEIEINDWSKDQMNNDTKEVFGDENWETRQRVTLAKQNIKEVKAGSKYRCVLCNKAFKGASYVQKHILLKHQMIVDIYVGKTREKETLENYSTDRNKITSNHFKQDDGRGRGRGNFRGGGRFNLSMRDRRNRPMVNKMDAPLPSGFDRQLAAPQILQPQDKVRTVRNYEGVQDDLAIDDLLDFGFGDFEKGPKFNL